MRALVHGASRGIGLRVAENLLAADASNEVIASSRAPTESSGLQALVARFGSRVRLLPLDSTNEESIERAAARASEAFERLHLLVNCAGVLHDGAALRPEKRLEALDAEALRRSFEVNAIGPALVARSFFPLLAHDERAVVANLSARVGSIEDNRIGGWYGYRASKAAQNMLTRTLAIELGRRAPNVICVALHPGTVETDLSRPFLRAAKRSTVHTPAEAAKYLVAVIDGLTPADTGRFIAWDGTPIPW